MNDKHILKFTFMGDDAYKREPFYVKKYASTLFPIPPIGSIIEYVIVKNRNTMNFSDRMRSISTNEEIDEDFYKRSSNYTPSTVCYDIDIIKLLSRDVKYYICNPLFKEIGERFYKRKLFSLTKF